MLSTVQVLLIFDFSILDFRFRPCYTFIDMAQLIPNIKGYPLGVRARGKVKIVVDGVVKQIAFRVRRNNGAAGGIAGHVYQDCITNYTYVYANTPAQNAQTAKYIPSVNAWNALSEAQKQIWRNLAVYQEGVNGYNLFMKDYMLTH